MFLLVIYEILVHFVDTSTMNDRYFLRNSEILPEPIQTQLSKKQTTFSEVFAPFLKCISRCQYFEKKLTIIAYIFSILRSAKHVVR